MTEHLATSMSPEDIGELIANEFASGETHVLIHAHDNLLLNKSAGATENPDNRDGFLPRRLYTRYKNMLRVCQGIGNFQSDSVDPMSFIDLNDKNVPPILPYHTVEASQPDPSKIVSYWDAQPKGGLGETMKIVTVDRLREWASATSERSELLEGLYEPITFSRESAIYAPILDNEAGTVRFNLKDVHAQSLPEQINTFFRLLKEDEDVATEVRLLPGDVLFIDNHHALHSTHPKLNQNRLLYRILLHSLLETDELQDENELSVAKSA